MKLAKSRIETGDIVVVVEHARLGSYRGEPRLAVAINEEYGWYVRR